MVRVQCRLVLDHLKIKKPVVPEEDSTGLEGTASNPPLADAAVVASPSTPSAETSSSATQAGGRGASSTNIDQGDAVDAAAPQPPPVEEEIPEEEEEKYDSKAVYSHWEGVGRNQGREGSCLKRARYCNIEWDYLVKHKIVPCKIKVIDSSGSSSSTGKSASLAAGSKRAPQNELETPRKCTIIPRASAAWDEPDNVTLHVETTTFQHVEPKPSTSMFSTPTSLPPRPKVLRKGLDPTDVAYFQCDKSDVIAKPAGETEDDITGSILELEQDEISTPKGAKKGKLPKSPDFPKNPWWVKPEVLLKEMSEKKRGLRLDTDTESDFVFPEADKVLTSNIWEVSELMDLKEQLNKVKSMLDSLPLEEWHMHTKRMNIAQLVMDYVKRYFNPEFSSQAWGKLFEILCAYDIIPPDIVNVAEERFAESKLAPEKVPFDSVHLCEAPGAFVSALNHFLKISYPAIDWNWLATTLNPYHEGNNVGKMINDDRLILRSLEKWTFLDDNTGNILMKENLRKIISEQEEKLNHPREVSGTKGNHVFLVTADGSIDCQTNPSEQEMMVAHLHFGEIVSALMLLQKGGSFVLKIFTFLEAPTICHLYLLSCLFKEVHLFKPSTSKEGNSEVYVVCLGFLGKKPICKILQSKLIDNIENYGNLLKTGKVLLPLSSIPNVFMDRIKEAAKFFCNYQIKIIRRNRSTFPCDTRMYQVMKPFRKEAAEEWIEWSQIQKLPTAFRLFAADAEERRSKMLKSEGLTHLDMRGEIGCFADKVARKYGNNWEKLGFIKQELLSYSCMESAQSRTVFGGPYKVGSVLFERPYTNIRSSRFCYGKLLSSRQELRTIVKSHENDLERSGLNNMDNICNGHSIKVVHESMAKSCDVVLNNLQVICFMKVTWDYVARADFEDQRHDLKRLYETVQNLEKGKSMFLCRFPMLTRLQTGFIYCLTGLFEKVIMYADPVKNVSGIMLHKFLGIIHPYQKHLARSIEDILKVLFNDEFNRPVLELVNMPQLLECFPSDFLVNYNALLCTTDMLRIINVVQNVLKNTEVHQGAR